MKFAQFLLKSSSVSGIPRQVERFAKFSPSPLSMKQFIDFGECVFEEYRFGRALFARYIIV